MIDLQCGRLNYKCGGSALGSIELVWGGNNSFGRALLPNTVSWSVKIMPEIPNFPKWIGWYYLVGYTFIISVVAAITYLWGYYLHIIKVCYSSSITSKG